MNLGSGKKGFLLALAIFGFALMSPVIAEDYTPTLGENSLYTVTEVEKTRTWKLFIQIMAARYLTLPEAMVQKQKSTV